MRLQVSSDTERSVFGRKAMGAQGDDEKIASSSKLKSAALLDMMKVGCLLSPQQFEMNLQSILHLMCPVHNLSIFTRPQLSEPGLCCNMRSN